MVCLGVSFKKRSMRSVQEQADVNALEIHPVRSTASGTTEESTR